MKHLELIKAVIDGKTIEWRHTAAARAGGRSVGMSSSWRVLGDQVAPDQRLRFVVAILAAELPSEEYRIQPKDTVVYREMIRNVCWASKASGNYTSDGFFVDHQQVQHNGSPCEQFKVTYDGETGKLKSVEIVE